MSDTRSKPAMLRTQHRQDHLRVAPALPRGGVAVVWLLSVIPVGFEDGISLRRCRSPIDLGIQNIPQETPVWCWAAVAQQIILALNGPAGTPSQCGLVAVSSGVPPAVCCQFPVQCARTGSLQEIRNLILYFGGHVSSITPPDDPMTVYQTLASGRVIIMAVQSTPFSGGLYR